MKRLIYLLCLSLTCSWLASCSSDNDNNERTYTFSCGAYYNTLIGPYPRPCQFFFFPKGDYVKVERVCTSDTTALPWNAYAITSSGRKIASVMQANYNDTINSFSSHVIPTAVNGYNGSTTEGTFYVVAIPYSINHGLPVQDSTNITYNLCNCYKAKEITKLATEHNSIIVDFSYYKTSDYSNFDGIRSEPVNIGSW